MAILDSRSGKDTFVELCDKHLLWCKNYSTVDFVKTIAVKCGWDGSKTPKNRAFLSDLKDLLAQWNDVPFKKVTERIRAFKKSMECFGYDDDEIGVVFIHSREPEEIKRFVEELGATTLLIRRESVESTEQSNHADSQVMNYEYDYTIENNGTEEELEEKAIEFLHALKLPKLAFYEKM